MVEKTWLANVVFCFILLSVHMNEGTTSTQKLEIKKLLKKLNKPAVKSIKSPDGDIIDCVSIMNQPALDHPKLRNHKIKMRPTSQPEELKKNGKMSSKSKPIVQPWHQIGSCPNGTIPIRRTREEDILRASSIQRFGKKNPKSAPLLRSYAADLATSEFALVSANGDNKLYGGKATINVWQPSVEKDEYSLSEMWVLSDVDSKNVNIIEAGWQVNPGLYGDNTTRLFTSWTIDLYQSTGCFDQFCSGFVQLNSDIAVGGRILPLSVYGDSNSQYDITVMIWKDPGNGDWWMQYGDDKVMGYWPSSLFPHLSDSATVIQFGGETETVNSESNGQHATTQMGSGHFPSEDFGKAAYFNQIKYVNAQNQLVPADDLDPYIDHPNCYDLKTDYDDDWGNFFFYGGPGRNPNCP